MTAPGLEDAEEARSLPPGSRPGRVTWRKLTLRPAFLVAVLLGTWLWFRQADLDPAAEKAVANGQVSGALWRHLGLTVISTSLALLIALPLGVLLTRRTFGRAARVAMLVTGVGRAAPVIALPALLVIWLGTGWQAALTGMVLYTVLPALSPTVAALRTIDPTLLEAAHGLGMSPLTRLTRVELPRATPQILTGVRTALVLNVGTATLAALAGCDSLGALITTGLTGHHMPVLLVGSVLTVALALLVDWVASVGELVVRGRGSGPD